MKKFKKIKDLTEMTEIEKINEGLRPRFVEKYDFSKTEEEKDLLKRVKNSCLYKPRGRVVRQGFAMKYPVTVHMKNKFKSNIFKTTYRFQIEKDRVNEYLFDFFNDDKIFQKIKKINCNGVVTYESKK